MFYPSDTIINVSNENVNSESEILNLFELVYARDNGIEYGGSLNQNETRQIYISQS